MPTPTLSLTVRPPTAAELSEVRTFLQGEVRALFPDLPGLDRRPDLLNLEATYLRPARAALLAAFGEGGEVIGSVTLRPYDDRLTAVRGVYDLERTAEVGRWYVAATRRGQGVGQALMRALTAEARRAGYTALCLHTHRHLPGGFAFWSRQGFAVRAEDRPDPARGEMGTVYMDRPTDGLA